MHDMSTYACHALTAITFSTLCYLPIINKKNKERNDYYYYSVYDYALLQEYVK